MIRRYGWAPRSERLIAAATHGHWHPTTFVAGLRSTGLVDIGSRRAAPIGSVFAAKASVLADPVRQFGELRAHPRLSARRAACKALDRLDSLARVDSIIFG